jgi:hypothetical protein
LDAADDDLVTHAHARGALADRPHDAGALGASDVEVFRLAELLASRDDVNRVSERGPHVV